MKRLALALVIAPSIVAVPATAATWSPPAQVGSAADGTATTDIAFARTGVLEVTWQSYYHSPACDANGHCNPPNHVSSATRTTDGSWTAPAPIGATVTLAAAGAAGDDRTIVIGTVDELSFDTFDPRGVVAAGGRAGVFAEPEELWRVPDDRDDDIEVDRLTASIGARGDAAAAWAELHFVKDRIPATLYAVRRVEPTGWERPLKLARNADGWATTTGRRGDAAVVWVQNGRLFGRIAKPGKQFGRRFEIVHTRKSEGSAGNLTAAIDERGRLTVVWSLWDGSRSTLWVARLSHAGLFTRARLDSWRQGRSLRDASVRATAAGDETLVAWRSHHTSSAGVRIARFAGRHGAALVGAGPVDAYPIALEALPGGPAALATYGRKSGLSVAVRTAGSRFGAPEPVLAAGPSVRGADMALDPASGQATVSYARYTPRDSRGEGEHFVVETTTRAG
jgi:hypothetical protein